MAYQCLNYYSGDTVIHVGELLGQTVCLPNPWGRTSGEEFQTLLNSVYHKVLQVSIPSWHTSVDTLTVWKRTKTVIVNDEFYAYIPVDERLPLTVSSSKYRHLTSTMPVKRRVSKSVVAVDAFQNGE